MKKFLSFSVFALLIVASAVSFTACGDDDDEFIDINLPEENVKAALIGSWEMKNVWTHDGEIYQAEGTVVINPDGTTKWTWTEDGGKTVKTRTGEWSLIKDWINSDKQDELYYQFQFLVNEFTNDCLLITKLNDKRWNAYSIHDKNDVYTFTRVNAE